ncbi:FecR family protein [Zobellia uliginosa]|uniref:FecR family protein n=1 Tax=Zobellia uliginosa TaxID=143224 RepID=A0ABY1KY51_9FLAO|nr:FecR domain-containing protein [Zobellia uliginosa]SIS90293.1 FecR family protein [Zobellia uliginosa]
MHQHKPISELLKRYILNECDEEETSWVISYFQSSTNSNDIPSVEEVLQLLKEHQKTEATSTDLSFGDILKTAKEKEQSIPSKTKSSTLWRKYASIAALFIGVLATSYFFWKDSQADNTMIIPPNAITLEMEDGQIQVLSEDGTKQVIGKNGNVVGLQKGNQIVYEGSSTSEKPIFNTLKVPYGKRFELKLSDGTVINLNAGTSLRYPTNFLKDQDRTVYLSGEAFFDVAQDSLRPFIVKADQLDVRVLGTHFNVSSYPEDTQTNVVLVEGSVGMYEQTQSFDQLTSTILEPGFMGSFEKENGTIETQEVSTDIYTSWMNGNLVFRNMTFESILKKMERHYNVSITNNNTRLGEEIFNASYANITIQKVLEDLRVTYGIDYSINDTHITINQNPASMK